MNIRDLLLNPLGKGSANVVNRDVVLRDLEQRYRKMLAEKKKFGTLAISKDGGVLLYVRVPSETLPADKLWYDVLIWAQTNPALVLTPNNWMQCEAQVWSNSPGFVYTYHYTAYKEKLLIPWKWLADKIPAVFRKDSPDTRNPQMVPLGYDKSIHWALFHIQNLRLYDLREYSRADYNKVLPEITRRVSTFESVMERHEKATQDLRQAQARAKEREKARATTTVNKTNAVRKTTKAINNRARTVKTVKRVRKVGSH